MGKRYPKHVDFRLSEEDYREMQDIIEESPQFENLSQFLRYATKQGIQAATEFSSST